MEKLRQGFVRTVFWSYERGSWPYDLMVLAIIVFVLVTPRKWFHDQPRSDEFVDSAVQLQSQNPLNQARTYRLDARMLSPEKRAVRSTPELEREVHDILGRNVPDLEDQTFQILQIDPIRSNSGSVIYYDITVHL
jgi:hypothetical protein